jgi:DNA primase
MSLRDHLDTNEIISDTSEKDIKTLAQERFDNANGNDDLLLNALDSLCKIMAANNNLAKREMDVVAVAKIFKQKKTTIEKLIKEHKKAPAFDIPEGEEFKIKHRGVDAAEAYMKGFYEFIGTEKQVFDTGYWFRQDGGFVQVTNFVVKPLYHIYSDLTEENRRMILVNNGMYERVVEMQSKAMMSIDGFCGTLYGQGNFLQKAGFGKPQLLKLLEAIGENFPMIYEMKKLGWQQEGVFAFYNKTYTPPTETKAGLLKGYDAYGVTEEKFGGKHLFSPGIGKGQELTRAGDDIYENDKYLEWKQSPITFEEWATLFCKVYGLKANTAIGWVIATCMRDIITKHNKIPFLYFYGPTGSGKSQIAESILNLFYSGRDYQGNLYKPFNLNQGTEFAFFNALETNTNTPFVGNEFDENMTAEERFLAFKAGYDGEGRMKGSGQKGRSKEQKISRTIILVGQFLGTKDDNSVINRSVPDAVQREDNRTMEMISSFDKLKELEQHGISSLVCDLLDMRPMFQKRYGEVFFANQKRFLDKAVSSGLKVQSRILQNITCLYTCVELAMERVKLPFALEAYFLQCYNKMRELSMLVVRTSKVSEFWRMVEFMVDKMLIREQIEFKVEEESSLTFTKSDEHEKETVPFVIPKKIMYMRISTVYKIIEKETPSHKREQLMSEESFMLYCKEQPWYFGKISAKRFNNENGGSFVTTCIAFDYDALKINLLRNEPEELKERDMVRLMGKVASPAALAPGRTDVLKFVVTVTKTKPDANGYPISFDEYYTCYYGNTNSETQLYKGAEVTMLGLETKRMNKGRTYYQLEVAQLHIGHDRNFEKVTDAKSADAKVLFDEVKQLNLFTVAKEDEEAPF